MLLVFSVEGGGGSDDGGGWGLNGGGGGGGEVSSKNYCAGETSQTTLSVVLRIPPLSQHGVRHSSSRAAPPPHDPGVWQ